MGGWCVIENKNKLLSNDNNYFIVNWFKLKGTSL